MRITTWNVNSVRLRLGGLERLVRLLAPDVLCLQETKVRNELFPIADLEALGFRHHVLHGQAGYHGVAIFARLPLEDARPLDWCGKADCRHLLAVLPGGIEVHNLYIPAGGDLPDPELNPKFRHKLEMIDGAHRVVRGASSRPTAWRSWSATSTSRRSRPTSGTTRRCSRW